MAGALSHPCIRSAAGRRGEKNGKGSMTIITSAAKCDFCDEQPLPYRRTNALLLEKKGRRWNKGRRLPPSDTTSNAFTGSIHICKVPYNTHFEKELIPVCSLILIILSTPQMP